MSTSDHGRHTVQYVYCCRCAFLLAYFTLLLNFSLSVTKQTGDQSNLRKMFFENTVEKEENAGNQHFLLLPQCIQVCFSMVVKTGKYVITGALFRDHVVLFHL